MINIVKIDCDVLDALIKEFDERIHYLKIEFNVELRSYGNIIRIALNSIQSGILEDLIGRLAVNHELEKKLDNEGYSLNYIGQHNPKEVLFQILCSLKEQASKERKLESFLSKTNYKCTLIADINDIDYLHQNIKNSKLNIVSLTQFKRNTSQCDNLIFYSFNGRKDFDLLYNLTQSVSLILYEQEVQLYVKQLQERKQRLEEEINGPIRFLICGIQYEAIPDLPINLSHTIEGIVKRIDDFGERVYNAYREEADILLDDIDEKLNFKIKFSNGAAEYLESNETVFTARGDLVKAYKLKLDDNIRVYPKNEFAEKLYDVAIETDEDVFKKVEAHSRLWISFLKELKIKYNHSLYDKLRENGLRVLPGTVDAYFSGQRKFPMYNNDLKAIFKLRHADKTDSEIDNMLAPIRKSKSTYNSTMIALGRGIKQEIKLFLKEKRIGEILSKLKFNTNTLQHFVNEYMPLLTITHKEEILASASEEIEQLKFIQHTVL